MAHAFLEMLHDEHEKVKDTFEKLTDETLSMDEKGGLFDELKDDLLPHMKGEEKLFYPRLLQDVDHAMLNAYEAIEEHKAAKSLLTQLEDATFKDIRWDAKLLVLKEMIEHHIKDEEGKVFKDAKKLLNDEELDDIQTRYEEMKTMAVNETQTMRGAQGRKRESIVAEPMSTERRGTGAMASTHKETNRFECPP
jgi:hypothetical protein